MANPQLEDGYTPIANDVLQALAGIRIPGEATQVLFVVLRKTWGFRKKVDSIPLSQFCEATGLLRPNVVRAINLLLSMNLIYKNPSSSINSDTGSIKGDTGYITTYCFNKDYELWKPVSKPIQGSINSDNEPVSKAIHSKETISKERIYMVYFDEIWKEYPNRVGKKSAERHFNASVKSDVDLEDIRKALLNYKAHLSKNTWKQPQNGSTWFNNWRDWIDWKEEEIGKGGKSDRPQGQTSADRAAEVLDRIRQSQSGGYVGGCG